MTFVKRDVGATREVHRGVFKAGHGAGVVAVAVSVLLGSLAVANPPNESTGGKRDEPLTMNVLRTFAMEPAVFSAVVRVTPHADNRLLRIVVDSDRFYASSDIQLDGLGAPVSHPLQMKALPAGSYCIEAKLFRGAHQVSSIKRAYLVMGAEMPVQEGREALLCEMPRANASEIALESAAGRWTP